MALISFGTIVTNIKGKVSGSVFSANQAGPTVRNKTMPRRATTDVRSGINNLWQMLTQLWFSIGTGNQDAWATYATNFTFHNKLGVPVSAKGNIVFATCNWFRFQVHYDTLPTPPIYEPPPVMSLQAWTFAVGAGQMELYFTPASEDCLVYLYATISYRPGKSRLMQSRIKFLGVQMMFAGGDTLNAYGLYVQKFGTPIVGQEVTLCFRRVHPTSWAWSQRQFVSNIMNP